MAAPDPREGVASIEWNHLECRVTKYSQSDPSRRTSAASATLPAGFAR